MHFEDAGTKLRAWLTGPAATLWLEAGVDRQGGGYYDQLSYRGRNFCN